MYKSKVNKISSFTFVIGCIGLGLCLMSYMSASKAPAKVQTPKHHKLGSGLSDFTNDDGSMDMKSTFNGMAVMLWGLVIAKAQQGFKASSAKDSATVQSKISNVTKLLGLIIGATICQFAASSKFLAADNKAVETKKTLKHSLKAPAVNHTESFYNTESSHYMGGAHNVALKQLAEGVKPSTKKSTKKVKSLSGTSAALKSLVGEPSPKKLQAEKVVESKRVSAKGAHNIALASVAAQAKVASVPEAFREEVKYAKMYQSNKTTKPFNYTKAVKQTSVLMAVALSLAFYTVLHRYHAALKKQEQLTKLFNNPNARVAAGSKGKAVLKKLENAKKAAAAKKTVKKAAPKKAAPKKVNESEETLSKILKLLEEQNKAKAQQTVVSPPVYQPPVIETAAPANNNQTFSYQLYDQATVYPTMAKPEMYVAPQPQPLLIPQQVAPVAQPKKEVKKASPTLEEIITLLKKTQAAQVDLESQK